MPAWWLALALSAAVSVNAIGQLPFAPGERLTYGVRIGSVGRGNAVMSVEGPVVVRGRPTYHLLFDIKGKVGFVSVRNTSESWLDPLRMASVRFHKSERHPLSKSDERAEVFADEQRWSGSDGGSGRTMSEQPLDELSFIYFLRTVPLQQSGALRFDRHYDASRNPTLVKVTGRETLRTNAGTFETLVVEMQVRDGRYGGGGTIRLHLSDDIRRIPVRIESSVPMAGRSVLTLESYTPGPAAIVALK